MTLTAQQERNLTALMPRIAPKILAGIEPMEALRQAINEENEFLTELYYNNTKRAQDAREIIFKTIYDKFTN